MLLLVRLDEGLAIGLDEQDPLVLAELGLAVAVDKREAVLELLLVGVRVVRLALS